MIENFKEIERLFHELDSHLNKSINIYIIGGAALLKRGLKTATKDIDLVVLSREDFLNFESLLRDTGFKVLLPEKEYSKMNLSQIFQRDDFRIDMFEKDVCGKFSLTKGMTSRAELVLDLKRIKIFLCSNEDILLFKTMTDREGDLEDCIRIATTQDPEWGVILDELKEQISMSRQDVWITWVGERFDILEEKGIDIPIMVELNLLREEFLKNLEKELDRKGL